MVITAYPPGGAGTTNVRPRSGSDGAVFPESTGGAAGLEDWAGGSVNGLDAGPGGSRGSAEG